MPCFHDMITSRHRPPRLQLIEKSKGLDLPGNVRLPGSSEVLPLHWFLKVLKNVDGPAVRVLKSADEAAHSQVPDPVLRGGDMFSRLINAQPPERASANQLCDLLASLEFWQVTEDVFRDFALLSTGAPFKVMLAVCDGLARLGRPFKVRDSTQKLVEYRAVDELVYQVRFDPRDTTQVAPTIMQIVAHLPPCVDGRMDACVTIHVIPHLVFRSNACLNDLFARARRTC